MQLEQHTWFWYHTIGWWIWVPASILFGGYLVWARARRPVSSFVPLAFLALWLVSCLAHYVRSEWHRYLFISRTLWLGGVGSIFVCAAIPLAVTLVTEVLGHRLLRRPAIRAAVASALGIAVTFLVQPRVAWWVADAVRLLERR